MGYRSVLCGSPRCELAFADSEEDDDSDVDDDPVVEVKNVPHMGGVNRIRVRVVCSACAVLHDAAQSCRSFVARPTHPVRRWSMRPYACCEQCMHQASNIVSTWADTGKVHIYDISAQLAALEDPTSPYLLGTRRAEWQERPGHNRCA